MRNQLPKNRGLRAPGNLGSLPTPRPAGVSATAARIPAWARLPRWAVFALLALFWTLVGVAAFVPL